VDHALVDIYSSTINLGGKIDIGGYTDREGTISGGAPLGLGDRDSQPGKVFFEIWSLQATIMQSRVQ
jgi:hypothetical protein